MPGRESGALPGVQPLLGHSQDPQSCASDGITYVANQCFPRIDANVCFYLQRVSVVGGGPRHCLDVHSEPSSLKGRDRSGQREGPLRQETSYLSQRDLVLRTWLGLYVQQPSATPGHKCRSASISPVLGDALRPPPGSIRREGPILRGTEPRLEGTGL